MNQNRVILFDTTLRDGEQTAGVSFHLEEKLTIAQDMDKMGVDVIEAGFAASSKGDFKSVSAIAEAVKNSTVCSLARCLEPDIEAAAEALQKAARKRIHIFVATSPVHMAHKLHMTPAQVLDVTRHSVRFARRFCDDIEFSCEDATRSDRDFLRRVVEIAIKEGATTVNLPDTVGYSTVQEYGSMFDDILEHVPGADEIILSCHCHNDLGLAVASSLEAVKHGVRQVECTVNGIGERAGNAALEEIVMGLHTRKDYYQCGTGLEIHGIHHMSRMIANLSGMEPAPNKPVVGVNAFRHASGIHQHGVLSNRSTYEIMNPEDLGIPQQSLSLGKLSGRHALADRAQQLGYTLTDDELTAAFAKFKELADRKKEITDRDILAIMREQKQIAEHAYKLDAFQIFSGNRMTSTATVTVKKDGETITRAATGDGPVEACFNAVDLILGITCKLDSYNLKAVTEGQDALGEVTVKVSSGDSEGMLGRGVSTDVLEASCLAYLNAANRLLDHIRKEESAEKA